jgi:hypothetical protein
MLRQWTALRLAGTGIRTPSSVSLCHPKSNAAGVPCSLLPCQQFTPFSPAFNLLWKSNCTTTWRWAASKRRAVDLASKLPAPMEKYFLAMLAAVLLFFPAPAHAAQMKLSNLNEICASTNNDDKSACQFYILGVTEGTSLAAGVANDKGHFCIPEGVLSTDMVTIVKRAMTKDLAPSPMTKTCLRCRLLRRS